MKRSLAILAVGGVLLVCALWWRSRPSSTEAAEIGPTFATPAPVQEATLEAREELQRAPLSTEPPAPPAGVTPERASHTDRITVKVRVVDELDAPIANARLAALEFEPPASAVSAPSGEVELELDFGGKTVAYKPTISLELRAVGFASDVRKITADVGATLWLETWKLMASGSIAGRVIDPSGRGVAGAQVACLKSSLTEIEWSTQRHASIDELAEPGARTTTENDGSFVLEDARHGRPRLVAVADQWLASATSPIDLRAGQRVTGVEIRLIDGVSGKNIAGRVVRTDGTGVSGANLVVRSSRESMSLYADGNGAFTTGALEGQSYEVIASDPEQRLRDASARDVSRGTRDLVLTLTEAPIVELAVVSSEGEPIRQFGVRLRAVGIELVFATHEIEAHPDGTTELRVPGRDFVIDVQAPGWMPAQLGPLSPATIAKRLEIVLSPAAGFSGTVLAGSRPLRGAEISIHREAKHHTEFNGFPVHCAQHAESSAMSADDGRFVVPVTSAGRYFVHVQAAGFARAELGPFDLDSSTTRRETIDLTEGGSLGVTVRSSEGRDVAGLVVALSRGDGWTYTKRCDTDGKLAFERLTPGRWQVAFVDKEIDPRYGATREGTKPAREIPWNCRVYEGQTAKMDLWIEDRGKESCVLQGQLVIDGQRVEGWQARIEEEEGSRIASAAFETAGQFRISVNRPGWYRLMLSSPMGNPAEMLIVLDRVRIEEGNTQWALEFETGSLEGTFSMATADPSKLLFHQWQRGTTQCLGPVAPTPDGKFRCAKVPAGGGRIVKLDPNRPLADQAPDVLATFEIEAKKTAAVAVR